MVYSHFGDLRSSTQAIKRYKMPIDFYYSLMSPPCRLVHMVAGALDLELNLKPVNVMAKEHLKPEFLKINPQHTIPTVVDDGFAIWESRAASRYLINKYGANSSLYPEDLKTRAVIDQRVDFEQGTLYARFSEYFWPQIIAGAPASEALFKKLEDAFKILDTFLEGQTFAAGSELTLADLALVATVSTIDAAGISLEAYPNITKWFKLVKNTIPKYEETNGEGTDLLRGFLASAKAKK